MSDRSEWFTVVDEKNNVVGVVAPEVATLLFSRGVGDRFLDGSKRVRLLTKPPEHAGVTATVPAARTVSAPSFPTILKKFTGESAEVELAELNSDNGVRLNRAFVGTNKSLYPQGLASDKTFTSLDGWLMAVHEAKQAGHRLACFAAPRERVAVVLDYDADKSYSLPFRYLYATTHGVQPSTVKAWGFENDSLELLRQVRDHNLRENLIAGKPYYYLNPEGVLDAQPDAELEALWKDDAEQVLAAFDAHTEEMKNQPGFSRSQYGLR